MAYGLGNCFLRFFAVSAFSGPPGAKKPLVGDFWATWEAEWLKNLAPTFGCQEAQGGSQEAQGGSSVGIKDLRRL